MPSKKQGKINPIWYALPIIEIIGFFIPARWLGFAGSMILSLVILIASIASVVGFFLIKKQSLPAALFNLLVGVIILVLFIIFFFTGLVISG